MDRDAAVILEMRRRQPQLQWRVATFDTFHWEADTVFDKSTLDAWLAEQGHVADLVECAHRCGRKYVVVSLYSASFVQALVGGFRLVTTYPVRDATVCIFDRVDGYSFEDEIRRQRSVVDAYFRERPLLTLQREQELRARFVVAEIALSDAYVAMFTEKERHVYSLADFKEDLPKTRITLEEALQFLRRA